MPAILFEIKNSIAFITLNRPEKFNAFNREMALSLQQRLDECNDDKNIRCVYITGSGKGYFTLLMPMTGGMAVFMVSNRTSALITIICLLSAATEV